MPLDTNPLLAVWHVHMLGQGLGERTVADRLRVLVQFERDVGGRAEDAPADVVALWLAQPWSRGTREHYWSVLKAWWRWLVVTGRRETSPLERLQKRGPAYQPKPASREQIRAVLEGRLAPDTRAKILLGAYAGLRVSEMASFRGEYLDAATRRVRILGKGESDHVLPVHEQVLGVAARYPTAGPWFPSPTHPGRTVTANSVSAVVSRAFARHGLAVTGHMLRHYFATSLLEAGVDSRIVQTLMRHRSLATTARYMKVFEAQQRDALAKLPAVWDGPL